MRRQMEARRERRTGRQVRKGRTDRQVLQRTDVCARGLRVGEGKGVPSVSAARVRRFPEVRCVRVGLGGVGCKPEVRRAGGVGREGRNDV